MANTVTVRKRKSQKHGFTYEYRFEIASVAGKRRWISKGGFTTEKDAVRAGVRAQNEYENGGRIIIPSELSFSDFLDYWIENDCKLTLKETTLLNYHKKLKNHIKPALGIYRLRTIDKDCLQGFLQMLHDNGYSRNTILTIKGILTKCFSFAVDRRLLCSSPALGLKVPKGEMTAIPTRSNPRTYLSISDIEKIFTRFPEGTSSYIPLMVGYHCGMRLSETFALTWENIDFEHRTIRIERQIQWHQNDRSKEEKEKHNGKSQPGAGYWYFSSPKYNSVRTIDMDEVLAVTLEREYARQLRAEEYFGERYIRYYENANHVIVKTPNENRIMFVCVRENGEYYNSRNMQYTSQIIHQQLNIPGFDYHSLRHTHATMLFDAGAPLKYIQYRLGHKNIDITLNVYQHFTESSRIQGNERLNGIFLDT